MNQPPRAPSKSDRLFLFVTAGLVMLILCLLAGMLLRANRRTRLVEYQLWQRERELGMLRQREGEVGMLRKFLQSQPLIPAVDRDKLAITTVTIDGRQVHALRLPHDLAERIGLAAGDVVLVEPPPATATAPATQPAP